MSRIRSGLCSILSMCCVFSSWRMSITGPVMRKRAWRRHCRTTMAHTIRIAALYCITSSESFRTQRCFWSIKVCWVVLDCPTCVGSFYRIVRPTLWHSWPHVPQLGIHVAVGQFRVALRCKRNDPGVLLSAWVPFELWRFVLSWYSFAVFWHITM